MIKNVFIPNKIGNYYIFPQRIIGFDIGKTHVNATQMYIHGTTHTIEKCCEEKLDAGQHADYPERVIKALSSILQRIDRFDHINTALPSSLVIYKELTLPFINANKISMVLDYEVEPLLPFSLEDAVIDFIITKTDTQKQSSDVLIAAVQKQHIVQHINLFEQAGVTPSKITVDAFALYGVYKAIPSYMQLKGSVVIIDLGFNETRLSFLDNGQLRFIRTLDKGVTSIAKMLSQELNVKPHEALDYIIRFGLEKSENRSYTNAIEKALKEFWNKVKFTLDSFTTQLGVQQEVKKIILLGGGSEIKELVSFVMSILGIPCERFDIERLARDKTVKVKMKGGIPRSSIMSLSAAFPSSITEDFNLRKDEFSIEDTSLFYKQFGCLYESAAN